MEKNRDIKSIYLYGYVISYCRGLRTLFCREAPKLDKLELLCYKLVYTKIEGKYASEEKNTIGVQAMWASVVSLF